MATEACYECGRLGALIEGRTDSETGYREEEYFCEEHEEDYGKYSSSSSGKESV